MRKSFKANFSLGILALTLIIMTTAVLSSCGSSETGTSEIGQSSGTVTENENSADKTENPFESDSLPADLNFNGSTVTVFYREEEVNEFYMNEQTGDIVEDAVYTSNKNVEERLNVKLDVVTMNGNSGDDRTKYVNAVKASVLSGDDTYQLITALTYNAPAFIQDGLLLNLMDVPHLDFDKPWWVNGLTDVGSIGGRLFIVSGDASLSLMKKTLCIYFNVDMVNDMGVDSPYKLVHSGKWTIDKLKTISTGVYNDLNGDGAVNTDDRYGFAMYDRNHMNAYIGAFDLEVTDKDDDGYPMLVFGNERVVSAVEYLVKLFNENDGIFNNSNSDAGNDLSIHNALRDMFTSGRLMFISAEFNNADFYRDMEDEYGVLPFPKWDESQDGYYTVARNIYSSFVIPKTCVNTELAGAVLEAIASENYRTLSPVYYEMALKVKYSRDNESAQMYDIIKSGLKFNFGYTYHLIVNMTDLFVDAAKSTTANWASTYATKEAASVANIEKFIAAVEENS